MDHLYFITNKFIQTYSSTKLIYLPLIVDNINIINTLFDTHLLLFNVNSSSLIGYVVKELKEYKWSSYLEYLGLAKEICFKDEVLEQFKSAKNYERFVLDQVDYARRLDFIKHQVIDYEQ